MATRRGADERLGADSRYSPQLCFEKILEKSRIVVRKLEQDIVNEKFQCNICREGESKNKAETLTLTLKNKQGKYSGDQPIGA